MAFLVSPRTGVEQRQRSMLAPERSRTSADNFGERVMWVERGRETETEEPGDDSRQGHFSMCSSGVLLRSTWTTHASLRLDAHVRRGGGSILYWVGFLPSEILP